MRLTIVFLCLMIVSGCRSNKQVNDKSGPLHRMKAFHVVMFFSPYENYNQKEISSEIIGAFKKIGRVQVVALPDPILSTSDTFPVLLISLGGYQEKNRGSIQVYDNVKILVNGYKTACQIWKTDYIDDNLYPTIENDQIAFKENKVPQDPIKSADLQSVIEQMIEGFYKEYQQDNPKEAQPIFYIQQLFQQNGKEAD